MDKKKLRDSLVSFHSELENARSINPEDRKKLEHLEKDIQDILERDAGTNPENETLTEQLGESIRQFEITHPQLTFAMGHLLDILSQEGI